MECKNCKTPLQKNDLFCSNCGAKIVTKRLTFSSLLEEMFSTLFSWDNKFFKTFTHMLTQPETIILGYINGVRKKYVKPIAYLIAILTIYGIYMYLIKDSYNDYFETLQNRTTQGRNAEILEKQKSYNEFLKNAVLKHSNVLSSLMIPIMALITSIVFRKRSFNYIEHNLMFIYITAQTTIIGTIIGLFGFLFSVNILTMSFIVSLLMFVFQGYVITRVFQLNWKQVISKFLLSILLGFLLYIIIVVIVVVFFFING
jgi:hypothetical protein